MQGGGEGRGGEGRGGEQGNGASKKKRRQGQFPIISYNISKINFFLVDSVLPLVSKP